MPLIGMMGCPIKGVQMIDCGGRRAARYPSVKRRFTKYLEEKIRTFFDLIIQEKYNFYDRIRYVAYRTEFGWKMLILFEYGNRRYRVSPYVYFVHKNRFEVRPSMLKAGSYNVL